MICKCGSSDVNVSSAVIGLDENAVAVECSAAITCANCYRLLASGNAVIPLNPFYHNAYNPLLAKVLVEAARENKAAQ